MRSAASPGPAARGGPDIPTPLAIVAFLAAVSLVAYRTATQFNVLGDPRSGRFGLADFRDGVYFPVVAFLSGHNPYDPSVHLSTYPVYYPFPLYSPVLFTLHLPFGVLPFAAASWLYFALMIAGVLLIADLTLRLCGLSTSLARTFGLAALILVSRPGHWNLFVGQFAVTLTLGTYAALYFARRRPWLAATGLAVATIKPTFAVPLVVLLAARRDWGALARGLALAIALAALPTAILIGRSGGIGPFVGVLAQAHAAFAAEAAVDPASSPYRVDTPALVSRVVGGPTAGAAELAIGAALLALAASAVRRLDRFHAPGAAVLTAIISCLAILAWSYHQAYDEVLLAVPIVALASGGWAPESPRARYLRWPVLALLALSALNYLASENAIASLGLTGFWWALVASFNSVAVLVSLALCLAVALPPSAR